MSSTSTLTSPAPLLQSHECVRPIGGKNIVNRNSNVSNSAIASRGRGRGRSSRNRGRSSGGRDNQKTLKTVNEYQWKTIDNFVNTNAIAHPHLETSRPARSIHENLQSFKSFYKMFSRKIVQQIAAETNRYYAQCQQNVKNKYTKWVDVT